MKKRNMEIKFDLSCMDHEERASMEEEMLDVLSRYGWKMWASGAECHGDGKIATVRDMALVWRASFKEGKPEKEEPAKVSISAVSVFDLENKGVGAFIIGAGDLNDAIDQAHKSCLKSGIDVKREDWKEVK